MEVRVSHRPGRGLRRTPGLCSQADRGGERRSPPAIPRPHVIPITFFVAPQWGSRPLELA